MTVENKIVWYEGMFLQPQHFQQHDRYIEHYINQKHRAIDKNLWGFLDLSLDLELLNLGKIGILSASGIFADGTPFNIPRNDQAPKPLEIPEGMHNTLIFLALPLRQSHTLEAGTEDSDVLYRNQVLQKEVMNAIAGQEENTSVQIGSLALRLLTEHDDLSAYVCLPICRIKEARNNQQINLDKHFLTTWLNAHQADSLNKFINEVHTLLTHRAEMLAGRLTDTEQAGTAEVVDLLLLQMANKYENIFCYLKNKTPLHPEKLFCILLELVAELATFTNNKRRPDTPPIYQHKDLLNTFKPVIQEVRHALSMVLEQNATAIPLEQRDHGRWVGIINDRELLSKCSFVLAVYSDTPTENLRTILPSRIKIAPVEQLETLVQRALPGIAIEPIAIAPRQIPYHANFSYFVLKTQHELWELLNKSAGIGMHISGNLPGLILELWAIKG